MLFLGESLPEDTIGRRLTRAVMWRSDATD